MDVNLDTLWKAITDNWEVFISVINKVSDDFTARTSDFVGDLEMLSSELNETNRALQIIEKKGDANAKEIQLTFMEFEAMINSWVHNEAAAWKAVVMRVS